MDVRAGVGRGVEGGEGGGVVGFGFERRGGIVVVVVVGFVVGEGEVLVVLR